MKVSWKKTPREREGEVIQTIKGRSTIPTRAARIRIFCYLLILGTTLVFLVDSILPVLITGVFGFFFAYGDEIKIEF